MNKASILLCASLAFVSPIQVDPPRPIPAITELNSLETLVARAQSEGHDISRFFHHPKFMIYQDIARHFPSEKAKQFMKARWNSMSAAEQEKDLENRVKVYKKKIDFDAYCRKIPGFLSEHSRSFQLAEEHYSVPKELIASILVMETRRGELKGTYYPFNVYVSLYVKGEPKRKEWAYVQLIELLSWSDKHNKDVFSFKSSYAGAIGYAQFIPSSLNRWWVGGDVYDMHENILSVGNYIAANKQGDDSYQTAVKNYNRWDVYVRIVLDMYERTKGLNSSEAN
jgi:membrane-bound lytic murein transglycosylase B